MAEKTPGQLAGVERLREWAVTGPGAALFDWGAPGDFARCQVFYKDKIPGHMIDGWCATLHKLATGATPGHAAGEQTAHMPKGD